MNRLLARVAALLLPRRECDCEVAWGGDRVYLSLHYAGVEMPAAACTVVEARLIAAALNLAADKASADYPRLAGA